MIDGARLSRALPVTLAVLLLGILLAWWLEYNHQVQQTRARSKAANQEGLAAAQQYLSGRLERLREEAQALGEAAIRGEPTALLLAQQLTATPELYGVGIAYAPDSAGALDATYLVRDGHHPRLLEPGYDYTRAGPVDPADPVETSWFTEPQRAGAPVWVRPFVGRKSRALVVSYGYPVYRDLGMDAVLSFNFDLDGLQELFSSAVASHSDYLIVLDSDDLILLHPDGRKIGQRCSDLKVDECGRIILAEESGETEPFVDPVTQRASWLSCRRAARTDWLICMASPQIPATSPDGPFVGAPELKLARIQLASAAGLAVVLVLLAHAATRELSVRRLWGICVLISAVEVLLIGWIWQQELAAPIEQAGVNQLSVTMTRGELDQNRPQRLTPDLRPTEGTFYVPTGIFLQSLEFSASNNVDLTGYIWQEHVRGLEPGFVFPEAISMNQSEPQRLPPGCVDDCQATRWYFETTLREPFNTTTYPMDPKVVWVRIWHSQFSRDIILVPAFHAYSTMIPAMNPGIESEFVLDGWELRGTLFGYRNHYYNADFGVENYAGQYDFPELHFAVLLQRRFLDPFISYLVPLLIIASMLFVVMLRAAKEEMKAVEIVGSNSGLFFLILLAHIQLRQALGAPDIVYLEHFFFTMYLYILGVTVLALLETTGQRVPLLQRRQFLYVHLAYWPVLFGMSLLATLRML